MIVKKIPEYLGLTVLALALAYFFWMSVLMIATITPLKGFSVTTMLVLLVFIFVVMLIISIILFGRHRKKGFLCVIGAVIFTFLLCFIISDRILQNQLNGLKKSFEKLGYPLDIESLGKVPENQNAASLYEQAIDLLKDGKVPDILDDLRQSMGAIELSRKDFDILEKWVNDNRAVIRKLDDIEKYPKFRYREYAEYKYRLYALPLINLMQIRRLGGLLMADAIINIGNGNQNEAQQSFKKLIHLNNSLGQEYNLIYSLVATSVTKNVFSIYGYELIHYKEPIISLDMVDKLAYSSSMERGLCGEAILIYNFHGRPKTGPVLYFGVDHFVKTFKREYLKIIMDLIQLSKGDVYPSEQIKRLKISIVNLPEFPYSIFTLPNFESFEQSEYKYKTTITLLHILSALTKYREKYGAFPENLHMLVNDGLIRLLPNDAFSGRPFIYRNENDEIIIYSVGADMTDDGGDFKNNKDIGYRLRS